MRRILRQELDGDITKESVIYVTTLLESQLHNIVLEVKKQHEEENRLRVFHGLPERKRIDVTLYKKVVEIPYKSTSNLISEGEVGQHNIETTLSDKQGIEVA
jgi:hypothetical protein